MVDIPYRRELEFSYGTVAHIAPGNFFDSNNIVFISLRN